MTSDRVAFLFEDFNPSEKPEEVAEAPPTEPTFSAAELATARLESWNDGYLAAASAKSHDLGRQSQHAFTELLARADDIDIGLGRMAEQSAAAIARWLVATFVAAFPNLINHSMAGRTQAVTQLLQSALKARSKIEVRAENGPPLSFSRVHDACRQIEAHVAGDSEGGSIAIAWQLGEAQIHPSRTWEEILNAILPLTTGDVEDAAFELRVNEGKHDRHVR